MKAERVYKFNFDANGTTKIRAAIDERANFALFKEKDVKVREAKGKSNTKKILAYDSIYVSLTRIEDTLQYINMMELGKNHNQRSAFDFFDFLNNMYVVIHCMKTLAVIFEVSPDKIKELEQATDCFNQVGLDGTGNDSGFFEYVRSLASVHPADTGRHPAYHGYGKIHCSPFAVWTWDGLRMDGDISLHIYTSERDGDIETLQLSIGQFEKYLQKWIDFELVIVDAIKSYNDKTASEYAATPIARPEEFESYDMYVANLKKELIIREGDYNGYILERYEKLFRLKMSDTRNDAKFQLYKNAVVYSLKFLHERLQLMANDEESYTGILYPEENTGTALFIELWKSWHRNSEISKYGYEMEKLHCIDGSGSYDERYARTLLVKLKPIINKYVYFTNEEPAFETHALISMAIYFECLGLKTVINRNIPNTLEFREYVLSEDEWNEMLKLEPKREGENRFRKFLKEHPGLV